MKISINCGYCSLKKNCSVKNDFRLLAKSIKDDLNVLKFKLHCPLLKPKYETKQNVVFTIATGCHRVINEWECTYDRGCGIQCSNYKKCKDGIVKFKGRKYKSELEFNGIIEGYLGKGKYIIKVNWHEFIIKKQYLNRYDLLRIQAISNRLKYFDDDKDIYFVSKEKFIK